MSKVIMDEGLKSKFNFLNLFSNIRDKMSFNEESEDEKLIKMLKEAHREWEEAENYFQMVSEPDLIDYAIHRMEATKTKYIYLLKQVKEKGVTMEG